ncbi:RNA polymerase sigma factor [Roseivirga sp. BDSF3-8]|uniref:RNA polymerase sigma factor n=1 Tax=Roseivirga sp. BDSF3-8 TaxID=3241598 RepID=UPI00353231EE
MQEELESIAIENARKGNPAGCRYLIDRYKDYVFSIALRILSHREEAEEAAQDAFMKAFQGLGSFSGQSKFSTWLYRIACNEALARARKKKRYAVDIDDVEEVKLPWDSFADQYKQLEHKTRQKYIRMALDRLPDNDRLLISLYYLQEQSVAEVAEVTGQEANTVKVRIHRARKKLHTALAGLLETELKELL